MGLLIMRPYPIVFLPFLLALSSMLLTPYLNFGSKLLDFWAWHLGGLDSFGYAFNVSKADEKSSLCVND